MSSSVVEQVGICMNQQGTGPTRPAKLCCFCWCCCCTCSCTRKCEGSFSCHRFSPLIERTSLAVKDRENDTNKHKSTDSDQQSCLSEPLPPPEEVKGWGKSFDKLMKSRAGRNVFREFLRCEYSEENILFWSACEELKSEEDPGAIVEKAKFIYEDYISILSPREVSLDSRVRDIVNQNMVAPTVNTFDEAQHQIYTLMHRDSYPRFINSNMYKKMLQLCSPDSEQGTPPPPQHNNSSSNI